MTLRHVLGPLALLMVGCIPPQPAQSTVPEPVQVAGPPGGVMDPQPGYQPYQQPYDPQQQPPGDPRGYAQEPGAEVEADVEISGELPEPSTDPADPGYATGDVSDGEIDSTLAPYGDWIQDDDYGRVWRPDTTAVGVDFTPYESDGSWVWSDAGWSFNSGLGWGWLPFHYGRWGWFGNYWGWVPGRTWSPGAVEWRNGGGYVGWRPLSPEVGGHQLASHDANWRFASEGEFGRTQIRGHLFNNPAEGLRVTRPVASLPIKGNYSPVGAASVMRGRLAANNPRFGGAGGRGTARMQQRTYRQPSLAQQPTWRRPAQSYSRPTYSPSQSYRSPIQSFHSGPSPSYQHSSGGYSSHSSSSGSTSHSSGSSGGHSSGGGGHSGGGHHR